MASSSLPLFKGSDGDECESFIRAIRTRALQEGKQRDAAWMADFAGTLLSRKALSWHCRLPQDVRQDWFKLEIALLDRWCFPEEEDEPRSNLKPTPAAAPSINPNSHFDGVFHLKVVPDGSNTSYFVKFKGNGKVAKLATEASDALRIRCYTSSSCTLMERVGAPDRSWVTIQWENNPYASPNTRYALLSSVKFKTLKSAWSYETPWQLLRCTVSSNRQIIPVWEDDETGEFTLNGFCDSTSESVRLAADSDAYSRAYSQYKRAKMFIEPVN